VVATNAVEMSTIVAGSGTGAASPTQLAYAYGTRVEVTEKGTTTSPLWLLSARVAHPTSSAVTGTLLKY